MFKFIQENDLKSQAEIERAIISGLSDSLDEIDDFQPLDSQETTPDFLLSLMSACRQYDVSCDISHFKQDEISERDNKHWDIFGHLTKEQAQVILELDYLLAEMIELFEATMHRSKIVAFLESLADYGA